MQPFKMLQEEFTLSLIGLGVTLLQKLVLFSVLMTCTCKKALALIHESPKMHGAITLNNS